MLTSLLSFLFLNFATKRKYAKKVEIINQLKLGVMVAEPKNMARKRPETSIPKTPIKRVAPGVLYK